MDNEKIEKTRTRLKEYNEKVWDRILSFLEEKSKTFEDDELLNIMVYLPKERRKKSAIRPFSAYLGYLLSDGDIDSAEIINISAGVEMLNTSITYIDDKIFDNDEKVGDILSLHKKFDINASMIASSLFRSFGREIIIDCFSSSQNGMNLFQAVKILESINQNCDIGQFLDVRYGNMKEIAIENSERIPELINDLRTGQFIRRAAELGALLAFVSEADFGIIREAFHYFGRGVQDANDLDDICMVESAPGSKGKDAILFKKTKPILKLIQMCKSSEDRIIINRVIGNPYTTSNELMDLKRLFISSGAFEWCLKDLKETAEVAISLIKKVKHSKYVELTIDLFSLLKGEDKWK